MEFNISRAKTSPRQVALMLVCTASGSGLGSLSEPAGDRLPGGGEGRVNRTCPLSRWTGIWSSGHRALCYVFFVCQFTVKRTMKRSLCRPRAALGRIHLAVLALPTPHTKTEFQIGRKFNVLLAY